MGRERVLSAVHLTQEILTGRLQQEPDGINLLQMFEIAAAIGGICELVQLCLLWRVLGLEEH